MSSGGLRTGFAAAPHEHRLAPWLLSTVFAYLPRASLRRFRVALAIGTALVAGLAAARLFGVALVGAALLMPLLTLLYFFDADVYESRPLGALSLTVGWGAASGVAVGLLAKALAPSGVALIDRASAPHVLAGAVALPALGMALALCGPLALLRLGRYREMLDGAAFGSVSAATCAAAAAIVVGTGVLGSGLRPPGAVTPWVLRLLTAAVATPALWMAAAGFAAAVLWLRYRPPLAGGHALGALGSPPLAVTIALALAVGGALGETFLPAGACLAWVAVAAVAALALLRRTLHLGLLAQAAEIELGAPLVCANCGERTAAHTFCDNCGIALSALPKTRGAARGSFRGRLAGAPHGTARLLIAYAAVSAAVLGAAIAAAAAAAPARRRPACTPHRPCGRPPRLALARFAFPGSKVWESPELGFSLRYDEAVWNVTSSTPSAVELETGRVAHVSLRIEGVPTGRDTPLALLGARRRWLEEHSFAVAPDTQAEDQVLGPNVGLRPALAGVFDGGANTALGVEKVYSVAIETAAAAGVSIAVTAVVPADDEPQLRQDVFASMDDMISSIEWAQAP